MPTLYATLNAYENKNSNTYMWFYRGNTISKEYSAPFIQYFSTQSESDIRRKRLREGNTNQRTLAYWQELACLSRLLGQLPDKHMYELAEKAKFSPHTITEEELWELKNETARIHRQLKKKSLFHQLYYRLILVIY